MDWVSAEPSVAATAFSLTSSNVRCVPYNNRHPHSALSFWGTQYPQPLLLNFSLQAEARAEFKESIANGDETAKYKECIGAHQDYFECLHQRKLNARINRVLEEEQKQADGGGSSH